MTPRTLLISAALAATAIILAARFQGDPTAAESPLAPASIGTTPAQLPEPAPGASGTTATRTAASAVATDPTATRAEAVAAVARGDEPAGFGRLHVETLHGGEPTGDVLVALRGTADSVHAPSTAHPWSYYVRAGSHVLIDVTDTTSGWVQTETTIAPPAEEVRTLTVHLNPPEIDGAILLRLVSMEDGAPIAGAQVIAVSDDPPDFSQLTSDATGRARVPSGPNFSYVITAASHAALELPAFPPNAAAFQNLEMIPFARVFGHVDASRSLEGSVDLVQSVEGAAPDHGRSQRVLGSSDVRMDGTWEIDGLVPESGSDRITGLEAQLVVGGTRRSLVEGLTLRAGETLEVLDQAVPQGSVTLEFVYPSGLGLPQHLSVLLTRTRPARESTNQGTAATETLRGRLDAKGRVAFPSLAPGAWTCHLQALEPIKFEVAGDAVQSVVIEGRAMISGRVVADPPETTLPENAWLVRAGPQAIRLVADAGPDHFSKIATTKEGGSFRFDLLPSGSRGTLHLGASSTKVMAGDTGVILRVAAHEPSQAELDFFLRSGTEATTAENDSSQIFQKMPFSGNSARSVSRKKD